jgi:hypothetical protein
MNAYEKFMAVWEPVLIGIGIIFIPVLFTFAHHYKRQKIRKAKEQERMKELAKRFNV